ncbi:MAG: hypothetical protein WCC53_03675 [Thermoanaerobaculia bacterium]
MSPARATSLALSRSRVLLAVLFLSLVLSVVVYARVVAPAGPLNWDEGFHALYGLRAATQIRRGDLVRLAYDAYRSVYWPPLHTFWSGAFFLLFGATTEVARASSLPAYTATALLLALAALRARGAAAALIAALGFLLSPLTARLAGQALLELPALALFSLSFYLYVDARRPALLGLAVFATYLTRTNYGVLLVLGLAGAFAADGALHRNLPQNDPRRATRSAALRALAALTLPLILWFAYPPKIGHTFAALVNLPTGPARFAAEGLLYYPRAAVGLAGTLPLLLVWVTTLVLSLGRRSLGDRNIRLAAFLALLQIVFAELSHTKLDRHILPLAVLLPFLLGVLAEGLWERWGVLARRTLMAFAAVLLVLQIPAFAAFLTPQTERDEKGVPLMVARDMARGGRTAFVASENALVPPATYDFNLIASRAITLDGAAALQTASELGLARSGASLPAPIGRWIRAEAGRWPGTGSYSIYLGLPRGDETLRWRGPDFPLRLAALVVRAPVDRIVAVPDTAGGDFSVTSALLERAIAPLGYVPEAPLRPSARTVLLRFKKAVPGVSASPAP